MFSGNQDGLDLEYDLYPYTNVVTFYRTDQGLRGSEDLARAASVNFSKSPLKCLSPKFNLMKKSIYNFNGASTYHVLPKNPSVQTPDTKFSDQESDRQIVQESYDSTNNGAVQRKVSEGKNLF